MEGVKEKRASRTGHANPAKEIDVVARPRSCAALFFGAGYPIKTKRHELKSEPQSKPKNRDAEGRFSRHLEARRLWASVEAILSLSEEGVNNASQSHHQFAHN